jgi:ABC-2 type transport system ATP-binding protein
VSTAAADDSEGPFVIEVQHLTKRYGNRFAVRDLNFTVRPGKVTGFLGPNGSGKSTTMRAIMGLDAPTWGTALINGRTYGQLRWPLREVGALLEAKAIHPSRSAYNHLWMLAQTNAIPRRRVGEVIEMVGLQGVANRRAGRFSLGMGQRLGIAAVLLGDPEVVLLDEPVNGLDPEGVRWIRGLLKGWAAEGRTVLASSHLMSEMALTAEDLIVIGHGELISEGPISEFIAENGERYVRVVTPQPVDLTAALRAVGATVHVEPDERLRVTGVTAAIIGDTAQASRLSIHEQQASLEEAFMGRTDVSIEYRGTVDAVADQKVVTR